MVKNLPMQEKQDTQVQSPAREDPFEEKMTNHSSILARKIPWSKEPGGLHSVGRKELNRTKHKAHTYKVNYIQVTLEQQGLNYVIPLTWGFFPNKCVLRSTQSTVC